MKGFLARIVVFCSIMVLVLEIFFRVVIPACSLPYTIYNTQFGLLQLDHTKTRVGRFTAGRLAQFKSNWRVNNYGWNSGINYILGPTRQKPCIAIIGDSYILGHSCDWEDHVATRLQKLTEDTYDVYSFGSDGANLMQYVKMARYASYHFAPEIFVFCVGLRQVERSLRNYSYEPLLSQLKYGDDGFVEIPPLPYVPDPKRRLLRHSAIIRYLCLNAKVNLGGGIVITEDSIETSDRRRGGVGSGNSKKQRILRMAAQYIVKALHTAHPGKIFVFVVDAHRNAIYDSPQVPSRLLESLLLEEACSDLGGYCIDLTRAFYSDYQLHRRKFNSEFDYHWNSYGNLILANSLYRYLVERGLISLPAPTG